MGKICSKQKEASPGRSHQREHKKMVIIQQPDKSQVYTREHSWVGLKNLHNTCFINSVLQCFSANNGFMGYLHLVKFLVDATFTESLKFFLQ